MFKILQRPATVAQPLLRSRPVLFRSLYSQSGTVNVQKIRIKRFTDLASRQRFWFRVSLCATLAWVTASKLSDDEDESEDVSSQQIVKAGEQVIREIQKEGEGGGLVGTAAIPPPTNEIHDEHEDDTFFIPLGFAYELPKQFYKGSDPEWQSFIALSKNELAGIVGQHFGHLQNYRKALGKGIMPRKYWLDIDFPDSPPPEYERKGLEISDGHMAWTTRPVHPLHYTRLQRALWPTSLASSVWASYRTLMSLQVAKIKSYLNIDDDLNSTEDTKSSNGKDELKALGQNVATSKQGAIQGSDVDKSGSSPASASSNDRSSNRRPLPNTSSTIPLPSAQDLGEDMGSALDAFKHTLAHTWRPAVPPPERGTVLFSGMVEIVGSRGTAVLDIRAWYHPVDSRWTQISIIPRRLQAKKQAPKGGI